MFRHEEQVCKKKGGVRKVWRRVQREPFQEEVPETNQAQQGMDNVNVEYTHVSKSVSTRQPEDVCSSLYNNKVGMIGLLETKVKDKNVDKHNFEHDAKGHIWITWKPNSYNVQALMKKDQLIHCYATQLNLQALAQKITEAWCILADFNSDLANFLDSCDLQEMRWTGAYYFWTNKIAWSRIGRVFTNILWYDTMKYTQTHYLPNGLSYHTALLVQFPTSPRPQVKFQFCDMWCKHRDFAHIIASNLPSAASPCKMLQVRRYLNQLRPLLSKLNRQHFVDLKTQQEKARMDLTTLQHTLQLDPTNGELIQKEMEARLKYIDIISSNLSLIQQQSKIEWIKYGDDNTKLFHVKAKQRKLATYIYSIKDANGALVEGFDQVKQPQQSVTCSLCNTTEEDEAHLFYTCSYAKKVRDELGSWWRYTPTTQNSSQMLNQMLHSRGARASKQIIGAIMSATIYHIWRARNQAIFNGYKIPIKHTIRVVREQVNQRILFLHPLTRRYIMYIDSILH
ncbi:hypothetical protein Cgig2_021910 [Carnegiea gigantea]|uniref:Reverse transcriptase zinc-binding domain-containing protein n=1 Tax=Carnegiea gigantea TaxID=171969 RepID=A0A9Q1Q8R4_9CARY|nr:hypothetical protein Cgig2_021910 [Carnegiea gigantea]